MTYFSMFQWPEQMDIQKSNIGISYGRIIGHFDWNMWYVEIDQHQDVKKTGS